MKHSILEVCADGLDAVVEAIAGGARRVELCRELAVDGLTPDESTINSALTVAEKPGENSKSWC